MIQLGNEKLTLSGTSQALPQLTSRVAAATLALIAFDAETLGADVAARFTLTTSENPTATDGMPLFHGTAIELNSFDECQAFRVISANGEAHTLEILYAGI